VYYQCWQGVATRYECAAGTVWDVRIDDCNWDYLVFSSTDSANNWLNSAYFRACPKPRPGFPSGLSYVQWFEERGVCPFCWLWWDCWPSVYRLSFNKVLYVIHKFSLRTYRISGWKANHKLKWKKKCSIIFDIIRFNDSDMNVPQGLCGMSA
jgi:hypothetical protein